MIIPTYNRASLLCETIDSILPQLSDGDDITIVDDGSTDNTRESLHQYGDRLRYIWQPNSFLAAARNNGIAKTSGEFLLFIDSDDLLCDSALPRLKGLLADRSDAPLAFGPATGFTTAGTYCLEPIEDTNETDDIVRLVRSNYIRTAGCVLIRRSAFNAVGNWDSRLRGVEDWDMWIRLSALGPFAREPNPVLRYRFHPTNMSADHNAMNRFTRKLILKHSKKSSLLRSHTRAWKQIRAMRAGALHGELNYWIKRGSLEGDTYYDAFAVALELATTGYFYRQIAGNLVRRINGFWPA